MGFLDDSTLVTYSYDAQLRDWQKNDDDEWMIVWSHLRQDILHAPGIIWDGATGLLPEDKELFTRWSAQIE